MQAGFPDPGGDMRLNLRPRGRAPYGEGGAEFFALCREGRARRPTNHRPAVTTTGDAGDVLSTMAYPVERAVRDAR